MVGYFEAFVDMYEGCMREWRNLDHSGNLFKDFYDDLVGQSVVQYEDLACVTCIAICLTILRYLVTEYMLRPFAVSKQFRSKDRVKFPESCWKLAFYAVAYAIEFYLVVWKYPELLKDPRTPWIGWHKGMVIADGIYFIYILEAGFYFHSIFATLFMDMWRKDSVVMLLHHCLALSLIVFSMAVRYHRIGLLVLFLHDISDVFLEFTKICTCFKNRSPKPSFLIEGCIVGGFLSFAVTWFVTRLYMYPLVVLYSTGYVARQVLPDATFYFFFNMKLWLLFLMNIWWFHFIVWLIYRILTGKSKGVEDTRELSEEEREEKTKGKKSCVMTNGNTMKSPSEHCESLNNAQASDRRAQTEVKRRIANGSVTKHCLFYATSLLLLSNWSPPKPLDVVLVRHRS